VYDQGCTGTGPWRTCTASAGLKKSSSSCVYTVTTTANNGEKGAVGDKGIKGERGAQGLQGAQGAQGDNGYATQYGDEQY